MSPRPIQTQVADASDLFFGVSAQTASQLTGEWREAGGPALQNSESMSLLVETVWFLVAAACREVFNETDGDFRARDDLQDDLLPAVITQMLNRMFDWSEQPSKQWDEQGARLLEWFIAAENDFGTVAHVAPLNERISLDDNLAGIAATRVCSELERQGDVFLALEVSTALIRAYTQVLPTVAALIDAYASRRARRTW